MVAYTLLQVNLYNLNIKHKLYEEIVFLELLLFFYAHYVLGLDKLFF